ncbi:hypothetical protein CASFOL_028052 [Castilleja foliolosa]|uniref:Replication factor A C-terminal domain-containing protein n=1 Tax=Castilleja foliolosa TaxID=1961234 RepID=A0ABD3CDH9_9LAMI
MGGGYHHKNRSSTSTINPCRHLHIITFTLHRAFIQYQQTQTKNRAFYYPKMAASYSMSSLVYFNISELLPGRNNDGVKVRVIRCYRQPPTQKSDPDGTLELVLHDEIEDRIHATMDYGLFKQKKVDIVEGNLYKIRNFMVAHDMSSCRSTTNPLKLRLYKCTTITPFKDSDFPTSMYRFRDLWEIANDINVDNFLLLDVIGRVVSYQTPTFVAKCSTRRMDFTIANTQNRKLGCSLWGDYIDPVLSIFQKQDSKPLIICIQFGKITRYRDEIKVANTFHITKVTINGHGDVFKSFLDGMDEQELGNQTNVIAQEIDDIHALFKNNHANVSTIAKLAGLKDGTLCWIDCTIFEIQTKADWFYRSCKRCFKKMPRDEKNRKCFICGEINFTDIYRYKIIVSVADSSGCASLLMWDSQCTTLIGKPAREMKQLKENASRTIPFEIEDSLMDKRVLFEIKCPAIKCNSDLPQYKVERVAVDQEIFDIYAAKYTPTEGSTTKCQNKDTGNEAISRLRKGKQKVDCDDDTLDNASDGEEETNLTEGEDELESEEILKDDEGEAGDDVTLKDLQENKTPKTDAKYSSRKKRVKINNEN